MAYTPTVYVKLIKVGGVWQLSERIVRSQAEEVQALYDGYRRGSPLTPEKTLAEQVEELRVIVEDIQANGGGGTGGGTGGPYQPLDDDLTAIAALASATNKMPYATGAGQWNLTNLTAAARTLLAGTDKAALRNALGLVTATPGDDELQVVDFDDLVSKPNSGNPTTPSVPTVASDGTVSWTTLSSLTSGGGGGGGTTILPAHLLKDSYSDPASSYWQSETGVSISGGQLQINAASTSYPARRASQFWDLAESSIAVRLATLPNASNGTSEAGIGFQNTDDQNQWGIGYLGSNQFMMNERVAGTWSTTTATFDDTHRWLRIRVKEGTVYWETSADGLTWTTRRSKAAGISTIGKPFVYAGSGFGATNPGTAVFDNFNVLPEAPVPTQPRLSVANPIGWANFPRAISTGGGAYTTNENNVALFVPIDLDAGTYDAVLGARNTQQVGGATTFRAALYGSKASDGMPDTGSGPLATATISLTAATGDFVQTFASPVTVPTGRYWYCVLLNVTTNPTTWPQLTCITGAPGYRIPWTGHLNPPNQALALYSQSNPPTTPTALASWSPDGGNRAAHLGIRRSA